MNTTYRIVPLQVSFKNIVNFTYIIVDITSKQAAIVDPAWDLKKIIKTLHEFELNLTKILLTHSHFDHVNLVEPLLEAFKPQIYMSTTEINYYNFICNNLNPVNHWDTFYLGQTKISSLLVPGHTAGGTCYLLSDSIFTGDTIFIEGCGICNTPGGNPQQMYHSIQMIKKSVQPTVQVFPGHSFGKEPGYTLSYLMKENIYFQIEQIDKFVTFRMRKDRPQNSSELE